MEVNTEEMTLAAFVLAPMVILGIVGMIRGYHMHLRIWKNNDKEAEHGND